ncbi:MAG: thymidylate kinase, partial [Alphaproteobacteria bacterium]|nr:thymidylate kinase [Alphaproteobacteria bacterium]
TQKVWPALKENKWVISDRFADSTMAYQYYAYNQRLSKENIKMLYDFAVGQFEPNLTFILDIDPKIGLARSFQKAATMTVQETRNENRVLQWHENLRYGYLQIAKENPLRCVVLDADTDIETLHQQIVKVLHERFEI